MKKTIKFYSLVFTCGLFTICQARHTLSLSSATFVPAGGTSSAMLVVIDGRPEDILKFSYSENPMTLAWGIYAGEGPLRERLATIVNKVLTDYTGLDFGVAKTQLVYTEDPMDNADEPGLHLASLQFFIDDAQDV